MALREKVGDKMALSRIYNNLGLLYRSMRRFPEALEYHRKSMEMRQELGDEAGVTLNVLNLAWVHYEMADLDHAEELVLRAFQRAERLGARSVEAQAKGLLGEIHLARNRMPEARQALEEAIHLTRQVGDVAELFMDLRKYASLELRSGNLERCEHLLAEAERYLPNAASPLEEAHWHLTMADLRRAHGDLRAAALSYEHAGNNLARLGHGQRAAEVFLTAAHLYHESGVTSRARDLVLRARQLYGRDSGLVTPKDLVDLEAALGAGESRPAGIPQADRLLEGLCRSTATVATAGSDVQALDLMIFVLG
jgi:tetratricopeptide (TPR) repeat protein